MEADGLAFAPHSVTGRSILEKTDHPGVRLRLEAFLGKARIPLQVDVGFGDPVTPAPLRLVFPCLLEFPEPVLLAYPPETVIAEKYHALVCLGLQTGRFKDPFDLWHLGMHFSFDGAILRKAIQATFRSRHTPLPGQCSEALSDGFGSDLSKQALWRAFTQRVGIASPPSLGDTLGFLRGFLLPVGLESPRVLIGRWPPGGPWAEG